MRKLLWVGDAACQTGFARATHETLEVLKETWNVEVLGLNYRGDPHEEAYPFHPLPTYHIWPAPAGGDWMGANRIEGLIKKFRPDVIILQNDPWNLPHYFAKTLPANVPIIGAIAIDGKNCRGDQLNLLDGAVFWTNFALEEARAGGFTKPGAIVPLGVDAEFWTPGDKQEARQFLYKNDYEELKDAFILLNVNRNNPRKRMDLTIRYFAEWLESSRVVDAYLHLHVAPTGDTTGYDCTHLAKYYNVLDKIILADLGAHNGVTDETLRTVYRAADLGVSTTQGEGWGLPAMEGMACGLPQLLPNWSAYGEWAGDAARLVPCSSTAATWRSSVIGGVPDEEEFIRALDDLYSDREQLRVMSERSLALVHRPEYRWRAIGEKFSRELERLWSAAKEREEAEECLPV